MGRKIVAIIQARMGSSRLPGKVLIKINGKSILNHVVERVKQSKYIDEIIVATTELKKDDLIVEECKKIKCQYFRGSESDVLDRYYKTAKESNAETIVRITSDCPLIDWHIIDEMIEFYKGNSYKIVSNASIFPEKRTYPRGLDVEIFSFNLLSEANQKASQSYQREHVTPYLYEYNSDSCYYYTNDVNYSNYRLTVDTYEDLMLIKEIYNKLYIDKHDFILNDIIKILALHPELLKINCNISQKDIKG